MIDTIFQLVNQSIDFAQSQLIFVFLYPVNPSQRIYWLYLLTSSLLAFYIYYISNRSKPEHRRSIRGFFSFLFPNYIWRSSSAWLDVRYVIFHKVFFSTIYVAFLIGIPNSVFQSLTGGVSLVDVSRATIGFEVSDIVVSILYMFVLITIVDFVAYILHYLQHKLPLLWEFHKVHHSLEVMHPLSNYREHPIDNIVYLAGIGTAHGLLTGVAFLMFDYVPNMPQIVGIPLLMLAFNICGYNLRHSHIWLRWPGKWSMVFPSPAHHHVHHSCHPDHIDKNFAFMFPCWDVLFRTYHLPETNKDVHFGIAKNYVNEFTSCLGIYFIPFKNVSVLIFKWLKRPSKISSFDTK